MRDLTDKTLISEDDIRGAGFGGVLRISDKALVTPLAADLARERHITIERTAVAAGHGRERFRKIALGADHGGFEMKEELKKVLGDLGCVYQDFGTNST